jgi:hypothetical protein
LLAADPGSVLQSVQGHIQQQGTDDAANTMGNFAFEVTLGYQRLKKPPRSQQRVTHDM